MNTNCLKQKLENINSFYNVILIDGPWGIGKTYFIKEYLKNEEVIYLSIFGLNSIDELKNGIYYKINKYGSIIKKKINENKGSNIGIGIFSLPIPSLSTDIEKVIKKNIKNGKLTIIIDDIERKSDSINIKELLGFIESLSQIDGVYIIMVSNEAKIEKEDKKIFDDFKEKVVKKQYFLNELSIDTVNRIFYNYYSESECIISQNEYLNFIEDFFEKHKLNNLRSLQKALIFTNDLVSKIKESLNDNQIKEVISVSFAVVFEINDRIYLPIEQKKNKDNDLYKDLNSCILKNYFNESVFFGYRLDLINYIINIYNENQDNMNIRNIVEYFNVKNEYSEENKDIFYLSKEEINNKIEKFYAEEILKTSDKDIMTWFKELNHLYPWIKKLNLKINIKDDEIIKSMDNYIKKIDNNISVDEIIDRTFKFHIEDEKIGELYRTLNSKIVIYLLKTKAEKIEKELETNVYNEKSLDDFYQLFNNNLLTFEKEKDAIIEYLIKYNFFVPNLDVEIDEKIWGFAHNIWNNNQNIDDKYILKFVDYIKMILNQSGDLGIYRINSLNEQYHLKKYFNE